MMDLARLVLSGGIACRLLLGQVAVPSTIRVSSEVAPAGGMAQVKVLATSPQPISSGDMQLSFSDVPFSGLSGIAAFSSTGDVVGAAVINSSKLDLRFFSPKGTFGTDGYPLMTAAVAVPLTAPAGRKYPVNLGDSSYWANLLGSSIPVEIKQGSITVGGSVSITNVVPGGGLLPAGGVFTIQGIGFNPNTQVQVKGLSFPQIQYIGPTQIQVTLKAPALLDGTQITVLNPDGSSDTYFSYLRAAEAGQSTRALLAKTLPVFSINTGLDAALPSTISPLVNPDYFTAVALQNPNSSAVVATIESHAASGGLTGSAQIVLPPYSRISREVSELFGTTLGTGDYLRVVSSLPIQMLGLLGNDKTGVVLPVAFIGLATPSALSDGGGSDGSGGSKGT